MQDDAEAFEVFREATRAVPVSAKALAEGTQARLHLLTHHGTWIDASMRGPSAWAIPSGRAWLEAKKPIEGGTSGGPVVDDSGRLVGLVSFSNGGPAPWSGMMPRPHLALPGWVWTQIVADQDAEDVA